MTGALSFDGEVRRGDFLLRAALEVRPGEVLGVVGANGAGKSSLLGAIAGTLPLAAGRIAVGDRELARVVPGSRTRVGGANRHVLRAERRIGHLDQRARLFPHLDAAENIAFGLRARGVPRREALATAEEWLGRVGLAGRGGARPSELSGGQQQRIAIARALVFSPDLVLLDEPFAALDVASASGIRALVRTELQRLGVPAVLVTHDPVDLLSLADRMIVLEEGRIRQTGAAAEVLAAPAVPFAAELAGRVLVRGPASERGGVLLRGAPLAELRGVGELPAVGGAAVASFDPSAVRVSLAEAPGAEEPDMQGWVGRVAELEAARAGVRISVHGWEEFAAEVPVSRAIELGLRQGSELRFGIPVSAVRCAPEPRFQM